MLWLPTFPQPGCDVQGCAGLRSVHLPAQEGGHQGHTGSLLHGPREPSPPHPRHSIWTSGRSSVKWRTRSRQVSTFRRMGGSAGHPWDRTPGEPAWAGRGSLLADGSAPPSTPVQEERGLHWWHFLLLVPHPPPTPNGSERPWSSLCSQPASLAAPGGGPGCHKTLTWTKRCFTGIC